MIKSQMLLLICFVQIFSTNLNLKYIYMVKILSSKFSNLNDRICLIIEKKLKASIPIKYWQSTPKCIMDHKVNALMKIFL